jgi:hypothetical protein
LFQFAYTGDYSIPSTTRVEQEADDEVAKQAAQPRIPSPPFGIIREDGVEIDAVFDLGRYFATAMEPEPQRKVKKKEKKPARSASARSPSPEPLVGFRSLKYPILKPLNHYEGTCMPATDFDATQSYADVLLSHAALFTLADLWLIDSLAALVLNKLHRTLSVFDLEQEKHVADVVELTRFVYSEEGRGIDGGVRRMVCLFIAETLKIFGVDEGFLELLEEGGPFVRDIFGMGLLGRY